MILAVCLAGSLTLTACGPRTGDVAPDLDPKPQSIVWPAAPQQPRYALAGVLIGEQDFVDPSERKKSEGRKALEWIVGLIIGEPRYKELQRPTAGLIRSDGAVMVVDAGLRGVAVFDMAAKQFLIWDEAAPGDSFSNPVAIADDGAGGWLVTDSEAGRVVRLSATGEPRGIFNAADLARPTGIARDPQTGRIYIADSARHQIGVFDAAGGLSAVIGGPGTEPGRFNAPTHLFWSDSQLFVSDTLNFRIQSFDRDGEFVGAFGQVGLRVGDLFRPKGVAVGRDGRVYVVESYYDHLLVFEPDGRLLLPIGGTGQAVGAFYLPAGVWTDNAGRVFVADMFNGRVVVLAELGPVEQRG